MQPKHEYMNRGQPYIGVTDFTTRSQVIQAKQQIVPLSNRRLHVGAMTSYKVQNGIKTYTGWEKIWLDEEGLNKLFINDNEVFNVIHYADYGDPCFTTSRDLHEAIRRSGSYLHGLQLDMVWPKAGMVREIKKQHPSIEIILQVGKDAMIQVGDTPEAILRRMLKYVNCVDYFLIDFSVGQGIPFDPSVVLGFLKKFTEVIPANRLALGGGLGPETTHLLTTIVSLYPEISWDAQGQMRKPKSQITPIEMSRVCSYVFKSSALAAHSLRERKL